MADDTYRRTTQKSDFFLLVLLLCAGLILPLVIQRTQWVPEANRLVWVTVWSALVGVLLARTKLPDWLSWLVGAAVGLEYSVNFAGKLLPSFRTIVSDVGRALTWVWRLVVYQSVGNPLPFTNSVTHVLTRATAMRDNIATWVAAVQTGQTTDDNTMLWLGVAFCVWVLTWNAGYELFRHRRTFAGLVPLGVGVVANVAFTDIGMPYAQAYMAITLFTLVWSNMRRLETIWSKLGLDFSPEVRRDTLLSGSILATVIVGIGLLVPYVTYNDAVWFFWNRAGPRLEAFYKNLDKAFAGRNPVPTPTPGSQGIGLGAHALGGSPSLSSRPLVSVKVSDPAPLPEEEMRIMQQAGVVSTEAIKRYWRERTYDVYTGHGWDSSERDSERHNKEESWKQISYPYTVVTQTYTLIDPTLSLALAVNEPFTFDRDYTVLTRGEGDLVALNVTGESYTVVSRVADATIEELRAAEAPYPDWVQERYLALPPIPARVRQAAEDVVREANAVTRYDKARAIEAYIRKFKYDLDLEPPPLDADVVDYYLFDVQRGYCDYSATAMVVMLRSVGVAARYASGYAMGSFDHNQGQWVVTEDNAHAWPEVYFPGFEWIEFEPTTSQSIFTQPLTRSFGNPLPLSDQEEPNPSGLPWFWLGAAGLFLVLVFVIVWPPRWFRRKIAPRQQVWQVYGRLLRRARWIGVSPFGGQTSEEYLGALVGEIERRLGYASASVRDIRFIGQLYQRARYSQSDITTDEGRRAEGAWKRLRGLLFGLALRRPPRRAT